MLIHRHLSFLICSQIFPLSILSSSADSLLPSACRLRLPCSLSPPLLSACILHPSHGSCLCSFQSLRLPSPPLPYLQNAMADSKQRLGSMKMEGLVRKVKGRRGPVDVSTMASPASGLKRHNDIFLPPPYTGQSAEVVWKSIEKRIVEDLAGSQRQANEEECEERQDAGGEMTLEDFLVMAGVPRNETDATSCLSDASNITPLVASQSGSDSLQSAIDSPSLHSDMINYASQHPQQHLKHSDISSSRAFSLSVMIPSGTNRLSDGGMLSPDSPAPSLSPCVSDYPACTSLKPLTPDGFVDKAMEKRQKRMIKNRESAARSRARKQAYTIELEAEVLRLREENARLKRQQVLAGHLHQTRCPPPLKLQVLQRTRSW